MVLDQAYGSGEPLFRGAVTVGRRLGPTQLHHLDRHPGSSRRGPRLSSSRFRFIAHSPILPGGRPTGDASPMRSPAVGATLVSAKTFTVVIDVELCGGKEA